MSRVFDVYGRPVHQKKVPRNKELFEDRVLYELPEAWKIIYAKAGVLFWFDKSKRVSQFVVFAKAGGEDEGERGRTGKPDGVGDAGGKPVTLTRPYPPSYPDAPRDKIAVQYAAIELAGQVGLGYDWSTSFKNTDPLCRRWIRPNIQDVPFHQALYGILEPLDLRYEVRDGEVVLERK